MRRFLLLLVVSLCGMAVSSSSLVLADSTPSVHLKMRTLTGKEMIPGGDMSPTGPAVSFTVQAPPGDHVNTKLLNEASVSTRPGKSFLYTLVYAGSSSLSAACRIESGQDHAARCRRINARTLLVARGRSLIVLHSLNPKQTILLFTTNGITGDRRLILGIASTIR